MAVQQRMSARNRRYYLVTFVTSWVGSSLALIGRQIAVSRGQDISGRCIQEQLNKLEKLHLDVHSFVRFDYSMPLSACAPTWSRMPRAARPAV